MMLRCTGLAGKTFERTIGVSARYARRGQQLFEAIGPTTRTRHRSLYRIQFGSCTEAFCANFCILRFGEFRLVYQLNHLGYTRVYLIIPYNAPAVTITMF